MLSALWWSWISFDWCAICVGHQRGYWGVLYGLQQTFCERAASSDLTLSSTPGFWVTGSLRAGDVAAFCSSLGIFVCTALRRALHLIVIFIVVSQFDIIISRHWIWDQHVHGFCIWLWLALVLLHMYWHSLLSQSSPWTWILASAKHIPRDMKAFKLIVTQSSTSCSVPLQAQTNDLIGLRSWWVDKQISH